MRDERETKIYTLSSSRSPENIRYVGKTIVSLTERLREHKNGRNGKYVRNWICKELRDGNDIVISLIERCGENWVDREKYWIKHFRERGYKLCNLTNGGDGLSGYRHTEKTKKLMSEKSKGHQFNLGRKRPAQSRIMKEYHQSGRYDFLYSETIIEKAKRTKSKKYSPIYLMDENNEIIKEFANITEASTVTGVIKDSIHHCIQSRRKGKDAHRNGFRFSRTPTLPVLNTRHVLTTNRNKLPVNCFDEKGDLIQKYESLQEASTSTGISPYLISFSNSTAAILDKCKCRFEKLHGEKLAKIAANKPKSSK